ncbi:adenine-specific DNA-methyltransferase [Flavobacterium sp. 28YEA47A]|uniref:DNA methyltransferase n=1 Tax=Flavobacterium sp. 28YEA47A TaxID=3156276 RepID=UPI0035154F65
MQNLQNELIELLKGEDTFVVDGQLNKNKVVEAALKVQHQLIKTLISNETFKKHFFEDIDGVLVFDKIAFQRFVNNKSFLPDSYTAFKNKIGLTFNDGSTDNYIMSNNDIALVWPHKDCILEGGQTKEDQKRSEIFWNETLAPDNVDRLLSPKVFTNFKMFDKNGEHTVTKLTGNESLILKGNNLLCLASLLKTHRGRIKLIYIDPPYNTGGGGDTFSYNNNFKRSTWLTFMKNRLEIAKKLLSQDGVLITAIDDHEFASLRLLLEEIFSEHTHETVVVNHHPQGSGGLNISTTHEYAIFTMPSGKRLIKGEYIEETEEEWSLMKSGAGDDYFRIKRPNMFCAVYVDKITREVKGIGPNLKVDEIYPLDETEEGWIRVYPFDGSGNERRWRYSRETLVDLFSQNMIVCSKKGNYSLKIKKSRKDVYKPVYSNWVDKKYNAGPHGTAMIKGLVGESKFSFPKSLYTVLDCVKSVVQDDKNAIVLDYHAGSGTTAHAVLELNKQDGGNRKFIMCEQMDYIEDITCQRIKSVISNNQSGSFVYGELMKYNQLFIERIQVAHKREELIEIWHEMEKSAFLSYQFDKKSFNQRLEVFKTGDLDQMKHYLVEVLDKNQLYVNYSEIEDEAYKVSTEDIIINNQFYKQ